MKDLFCLVTFGAGALCFAVFFATLKPAVIVTASAKADCQTGHPGAHGCGFDGPAGFSAAGLRRFVRY